MEKLQSWLESLLKVDVVWIDKGDGHWVKRRKFHPVVKLAVLISGLLFIASLVLIWPSFFVTPEPTAPVETPYEVEEERDGITYPYYIEPDEIDEIDENDLVFPYPGPLPEGVEVADGEYWIRIIKSNFRLYLYRGQDVIKYSTVAVGRNPGDKERVGDLRTPRGIFTVQSIHDSRHWVFDFGDGRGPIGGVYGPWFIRLRTPPWRGIGIHGTHDPDSLGTMASEGCIRMHNDELVALLDFVSIDMTVVVEE